MFDSLERKLKQAADNVNKNNYKKGIEQYEQILQNGSYNTNSEIFAGAYLDLGMCYYLVEDPYKNVNKAVKLFMQSWKLGCSYAKSWVAFAYMFGDTGPIDYQMAVKLFKEAQQDGDRNRELERGGYDYIADFMMEWLKNARILRALCAQRKFDDVDYALSKLRAFTGITENWFRVWTEDKYRYANHPEEAVAYAESILEMARDAFRVSPSPLVKVDDFYYDPVRLRTLAYTWDDIFKPLNKEQYIDANLLRHLGDEVFIRYFPKELIIMSIMLAAHNDDEQAGVLHRLAVH
jgi:tetratricopeptide (TPR) repeat protein